MRLPNQKCIIILFLIISVVGGVKLDAQTKEEISAFKTEIYIEPIKKYQEAKENKNEIEIIASGFFLFYKNFISSQDLNSCVFVPTCSEYALQCIKINGLIQGSLSTFDRLTRCNQLSAQKYKRSADGLHLIDPVMPK